MNTDRLAELRHDLRTSINHIIGYSEMMIEDMPDGSAERILPVVRAIHGSGKQLLDAINQALPASRTEITEIELRFFGGELQEPLAKLFSYCEFLMEREEMPGVKPFIEDIRKICAAGETLFKTIDSRMVEASEGIKSERSAAMAAPDGRAVVAGKILVVDDDSSNREVLGRRLEKQGHTVLYAGNGQDALDQLNANPADLVLLDMRMPDMNGPAVLDAMKANPRLKDVPVVVISASDEIDTVLQCIEHGAEDYITKPFDPVLLKARINVSLEKKRLRDLELAYLRNVDALTKAAAAVESGTLDADSLSPVAARPDELGRLARVFQRMVRQVAAREQRLQQQVSALKIEIDESRKARQVADITDTGYFQALQNQAQSLRDRRRKNPPTGGS